MTCRRSVFTGRCRWASLLIALCGVLPVARAHDMWLEPDALFTAAGQEVTISLHVGEHFHAEEQKPLRRADVLGFRLLTMRRQPQDLLAGAKEDQRPVARFPADANNALLAMERGPKRLDQDAEHFTRYLTEEGATAALAARAQTGRADRPGRERYTRYLKTLVQDREPSAAPAILYRRRVGQRLEILLENNPARLRAGHGLGVKVLFENRPLAGAKITAFHRDRPDQEATRTLVATTNAAGRATLPVDVPGTWLLRSVYLRPLSPPGPASPPRPGAHVPAASAPTEEPEWESFWASYVFGVRLGPASPAPVTPPGRSPRSDEHPPGTATTGRGQAGDSSLGGVPASQAREPQRPLPFF